LSINLGALTAWNPVGLFRPVMGQLYFFTVEIKCQLDGTEVFIADLIACWCGAEGYVSGLQDAAASCKPDT